MKTGNVYNNEASEYVLFEASPGPRRSEMVEFVVDNQRKMKGERWQTIPIIPNAH